ncbi:MAG: hypothetical protein NHB32_15120 [Fischerella sp. CENA71]|nr:hypothetical protein [Fischerella sp. CENA71]
MAKSFKRLRAKMSEEARAKAKQKTQELLKEILLTEAARAASETNQNSEGRPPPESSE